MLKFFYFTGDNGCSGRNQKNNCTNGNHCIDKIVAKHFDDGVDRIWNNDPDDGLSPGITHQLPRCFPG